MLAPSRCDSQRRSQVHVRPRTLSARVAARAAVVLAVTAAALITTATASFAVDTVTLSRTHGPSGGGYTLTISPTTANTFTNGTGPFAVQFNKAGTCPAATLNARPATVGITGTTSVSTGIVEGSTIAKGALVGSDLPVTVPA